MKDSDRKTEVVEGDDSSRNLEACRKENARLKDLIVKLSALVLKRVQRDER